MVLPTEMATGVWKWGLWVQEWSRELRVSEQPSQMLRAPWDQSGTQFLWHTTSISLTCSKVLKNAKMNKTQDAPWTLLPWPQAAPTPVPTGVRVAAAAAPTGPAPAEPRHEPCSLALSQSHLPALWTLQLMLSYYHW